MEFLNQNGATVIAMGGTPEQIADKLLQSFIAPAFSAMKKEVTNYPIFSRSQ